MAKAGLLFVGTDDGVVLFSNPGAVGRWLRVGHELRGYTVRALWVRPDAPTLVLATCGAAGVWRSADGGQSWTQALQAGADGTTGGDALLVLSGKATTPLIAAGDRVWRSADDGATWAQAETDMPLAGAVSILTAASYHIDTAFLGTSGGQVFQSTDRGRTWQLLKDGLPPVRCISAARLA